jgi:hypothetical protein
MAKEAGEEKVKFRVKVRSLLYFLAACFCARTEKDHNDSQTAAGDSQVMCPIRVAAFEAMGWYTSCPLGQEQRQEGQERQREPWVISREFFGAI